MSDLVLQNVCLLGNDDLVNLSICDGVISQILPQSDLSLLGCVDAEVVNADGRWVMPGLWDQHVHMTQWAINAHRLDVSAACSAQEAAHMVAEHIAVEQILEDTAVIAAYANSANWPDERTGELLDAAVGSHAVVIVNFDLHSAWVSSAGMRRYGFAYSAGVLVEEECFELQRRITDLPTEVTDVWVFEAAAAAAAHGVVGIRDMEMKWNIPPWRQRMQKGFSALRVRASVYPAWLDEALEYGMRTGDVDPEYPLLEMGPFKLIADGSLNAQTAWVNHPFPNGSMGQVNFSYADLCQSMRKAHAGGLECAIHAIGDAANTMVLNAFAETGAKGSVEHAQLLDDADVARFAQLGVIASVQPQHCLDDRQAGEKLWGHCTERMYRFADLANAGASLWLGSDAPVAPLDPWLEIQAAVDRKMPEETQAWHENQRVSRKLALASSTDGKGIHPQMGQVADLVLLDADPLTCSSDVLRHMPVAGTLLAGRFTYRNRDL